MFKPASILVGAGMVWDELQFKFSTFFPMVPHMPRFRFTLDPTGQTQPRVEALAHADSWGSTLPRIEGARIVFDRMAESYSVAVSLAAAFELGFVVGAKWRSLQQRQNTKNTKTRRHEA